MGVGLHGGGVATIEWLVSQGAKVTATDLRSKEVLASSLERLRGLPVTLVLGEHRMADFQHADIVVVNPGVPRESPYLAEAKKHGAILENDASIFFRQNTRPTIAVTGTRGKTTTTTWIAALLHARYADVEISGNTPERAFLSELKRVVSPHTPVVAEMSSWQLEFLPVPRRAPDVAVITNLYPDHLNRYKDIFAYARAKANIFRGQTKRQSLVLDHDDAWTPFFLSLRPKAQLYFVSHRPLPEHLSGIFVRRGTVVLRRAGQERALFPSSRFIAEHGKHNLKNLMQAVMAISLFDESALPTLAQVLELRAPRMRQEVIQKKGRITVVNDSCATSPDGVLAALKRFTREGSVVLVTGGTDKMLDYRMLARTLDRTMPKSQVVLLGGSGTQQLMALSRTLATVTPEETLHDCAVRALRVARKLSGPVIILFSPGAASFEKFLHEFDRGEKWNAMMHELLSPRATLSQR